MKFLSTLFLFTFGTTFLGTPGTTLQAQSVSGVELEIGASGSNQATGTNRYNAAIGQYNSVSGSHSLAIGGNNQVIGYQAFTFGSGNFVGGYHDFAGGSSNTVHGSSAFALGNSNQVYGSSCLAVGNYNGIYASNEEGSSYVSMATGYSNYLGPFTIGCFVAGMNNWIDGYFVGEEIYRAEAAHVLGRGLISYWNHSTIVGCYNSTSMGQGAPLLFAIGNGEPTQRSNAWEVYKDGSIKMPRQGDILMGEFGNPEP